MINVELFCPPEKVVHPILSVLNSGRSIHQQPINQSKTRELNLLLLLKHVISQLDNFQFLHIYE